MRNSLSIQLTSFIFAFANGVAGAQDLATLGPAAFQESKGVLAVNIAAGENNIQSSHFVSSTGQYNLTVQSNPKTAASGEDASVAVGAKAFQNAGGYISAQLAAGNSNQQHNIVIFSPESVVDWESPDLATQRAALNSEDSDINTSTQNVDLAPQALAGASGVIQMSQIAGTGNTARNTFQMPTTIN